MRLPAASGSRGAWPSVAVVVPARDEAEVLPASLPSLLAQDYPGRAEVFLVDDGSTDGTGELARELARRGGGLPLTVASPGEPPAGLDGQAVGGAARHRPGPRAWPRVPAADGRRHRARAGQPAASWWPPRAPAGFDLVSQMARLRVESLWERLVVPAFVYFFAQLYPFRRINRPGARTAAAAGGCVLLRAGDGRAGADPGRDPAGRHRRRGAGPGGQARRRPHLAGPGRAGGQRAPLSRGWRDLWRMVSRSAYAQLRHNPLLLAGTVAGLALVYLVPPVALVAGLAAGSTAAAAARWLRLAVMTGTYVPMLRYYRQPLWLAPLLPFTAFLYLLMTVDSAVQHYRGRGAAWKGRTY